MLIEHGFVARVESTFDPEILEEIRGFGVARRGKARVMLENNRLASTLCLVESAMETSEKPGRRVNRDRYSRRKLVKPSVVCRPGSM